MISMENVSTANFCAQDSYLRSPTCKALCSNADMIERCHIVGGDFFFCVVYSPLSPPVLYQPACLFITSECDHVVITHNIVVDSLAG